MIMSDKNPSTNSELMADPLGDGPFELPFKSPVQPVKLGLDDEFQFDCHKGIACFNECCRSINIQLTPYDIVRLKNRLEMSSSEFVARHSMPFEMDGHGMPGLRLATKPGTTECVFLGEEGCTVYEDRPAACRYYALGVMGVRKMESAEVEDVYFVVKEPHCLGHNEPRKLTVREYRHEQGVDKYDEMNREWRDVIIKKRSSGPTVGEPTARSMQLFDMCSYDVDNFRDFIQTDGFRDVFDLSDEQIEQLKADEDELLRFAFRFLKQALYGEMTIPVKEGARDRRLERRKELRAKHKARQSA
jgi:Fe-S-cluster containining protein